ncbi:MAG: c-type cytochrome [Betaproteobacteria bacterium]
MKPLLFVLGIVLAGTVHARGNADKGKELVTPKACVTCHGADGAKPSAPDQPILAGQHYDYLVRALKDYKTGARQNPIMKGFAAQLSPQEIEDLAAWFASQKSPLREQR